MGKQHYDPADVPGYLARCGIDSSSARARLLRVAKQAAADVAACQGLAKLDSALEARNFKRQFMLAEAPALLPEPDATFALLGVPEEERSMSTFGRLIADWDVHTATASKIPPKTRTVRAPPCHGSSLKNLTAPLSSASVERVFSILTDMDDSTRATTLPETLEHVLFIRAICGLVDCQLRAFMEHHRPVLVTPAEVSGVKRSAFDAAIARAKDVLAELSAADDSSAAAAAGADSAPAGKRARHEAPAPVQPAAVGGNGTALF